MVYEVTLTSQRDAATCALDIDLPKAWSYSVSHDTVTLHPGEPATILLTVTSPENTALQDYTIHMEAISLEDSQMTASLTLIASSKSELVSENMTVNCEGEDIIVTAFVSNMGSFDAENVKVQFFGGFPSANDFLGEKIIDVPSGESVAPSIHCTLPDGLYTFYTVIDPDDSIFESCEFNNELSIEYVLDRTPPEAEIFFDPETGNLAVRGVDSLDSSVDISVTEKVIRNRNIHVYTLTDDAGNTTELQLEIKQNRHEIKAEIIEMDYNGKRVSLLRNSLKIEYIIEDGNIIMLNQLLIIGKPKMHLIYNGTTDQTRVITDGTQHVEKGIALVMVRTNKGNLQYSIKSMREIV